MELKFDLSDKEVEFLRQYAKVYEQERDWDITADPIVVVEREIRVPTREGLEDNNDYMWIENDFEEEFENLHELYTAIKESEYDITENQIQEILCKLRDGFDVDDERLGRFIINYYVVFYEPVAYFLTILEAEKYMQYQKHNLPNVRVYTRYMGYNNHGDLVELRKMLLEIGKKLNKEEE